MASQAPLVLFALDAAGIFTAVEGRRLAAAGLAPRDLLGRSLFAVFADAPPVLAVARRALAGEELAAVMPVAGAVFETRHTVLRDGRGAAAGVVGMALDVSERARAEAELTSCRHQFDESREAERLRLAHELHDGAVQELVGIRYSLMASQDRGEGLPGGQRAALHGNQARLLLGLSDGNRSPGCVVILAVPSCHTSRTTWRRS